jgi:NADH:ubiquinone oxidoreductase subunit 6 (subunit J)
VSIGVSAFLIIAGAILRFAVTWSPDNVDLQVIGLILMIAGAVGLVAAVVLMIVKRRNARSAEVYEERRYIQPPP